MKNLNLTLGEKMKILFLLIVTSFTPMLAYSFSELTEEPSILSCLGCHGKNGVSGYSEFPNLVGLSSKYLFKTMKEYRDNARTDITMSAMPVMVKKLSDDDLLGLAEIFSTLPPEYIKRSEMTINDEVQFEKGEALINGDKLSCRFCHLSNRTKDGPMNDTFPNLTGQQKGYLVNQLNAYKDGERWSPIMNAELMGNLTADEMDAIAVYFRYLRAN